MLNFKDTFKDEFYWTVIRKNKLTYIYTAINYIRLNPNIKYIEKVHEMSSWQFSMGFILFFVNLSICENTNI